MSQLYRSSIAICTLVSFVFCTSPARSDNGTVVSGTVIAIDVPNQIMRVYVTAVDGQTLVGGPDTNYVDYLVAPQTAVLNYNNQLISQSNVEIGSQIQMQFLGAYASRILLISGTNSGNWGSYSANVSSYPTGYVQNYARFQNYSSYRQPYVQSAQTTFQSNSFPVLRLNHLKLPNHNSAHSNSQAHVRPHSHSHVGTSHPRHVHAR